MDIETYLACRIVPEICDFIREKIRLAEIEAFMNGAAYGANPARLSPMLDINEEVEKRYPQ